jgi:hypothetical protein
MASATPATRCKSMASAANAPEHLFDLPADLGSSSVRSHQYYRRALLPESLFNCVGNTRGGGVARSGGKMSMPSLTPTWAKGLTEANTDGL